MAIFLRFFFLFALYSSISSTTGVAAATSTHDNDDESSQETPEILFRRTAYAWQSSLSSYEKKMNPWKPWKDLSLELWKQFENLSANNNYSDNDNDIATSVQLDIVGALEESILTIERFIFEQAGGSGGTSDNTLQDEALSMLYTTYAKTLLHLSPNECLRLALDPHSLLIGIETIDKTKPSNQICIENAENSFRNAASLDATNQHADEWLKKITGNPNDTVHKRKPKEFVAELFDSFASTFDDKLLKNLQYQVPKLVGTMAESLLVKQQTQHKQQYAAILDAGCGTGLAGRYLRPLLKTNGIMIGVDASQKMLDKAAKCTLTSGCGLKDSDAIVDGKSSSSSPLLYDGLFKMDLEEMTLDNVFYTIVPNGDDKKNDSRPSTQAFDLIVAADVLVYFGSLYDLMTTFARLSAASTQSSSLSKSSYLIFSCELATQKEAPLGWRLLSTGRFAHTKEHAMEAAEQAGYHLVDYQEITPRMEKGEPMKGHLFAFQLSPTISSAANQNTYYNDGKNNNNKVKSSEL